MAGNSGGPWGGGSGGSSGGSGGNGGGGSRGPGGPRRPDDGPQIPEIDEIVKKGQERLRVLIGGGGGQNNGGQGPGGGGGGEFKITRGMVWAGVVGVAGLWLFSSLYTVRPEEQSVELLFGDYYATGNPGLNFAPWPFVTYEVLPVTREQTEQLGTGRTQADDGLMLTTDENIIDIDFEVVWNISDASLYLFNLAEPSETIRAVSEAAMREVVAQRELAPLLNRDREIVAAEVNDLIQATLDEYESGVNIVRLNLDKADPPSDVIDAFREVQAAEQERDRLERQADAYANRVLAGARGEAAQILEESEAYRARVVNEAQGEAARFTAVLEEYAKAPEVTRKRLYLETMERVLGDVDKVILDDSGQGSGGQGVVPYLPLNELRRSTTAQVGQNAQSGN
ncbi:MAG: FtsH protease activity modulator HflK [Pseudomonadota bacterium]